MIKNERGHKLGRDAFSSHLLRPSAKKEPPKRFSQQGGKPSVSYIATGRIQLAYERRTCLDGLIPAIFR